MARLQIQSEGLEWRTLELRLGVNHVGRDPNSEIFIDHPTISSRHCELALTEDGVYLHDCNSTNGTFVDGQPVLEAWLDPGQKLRLGQVEILVESTDANVAIPQFERPRQKPSPPRVLPDGTLACPRHDSSPATYRCLDCKEVMCNACVRVVRRRGGPPHYLCVLCSHECESMLGAQPKRKNEFFAFFQRTMKLSMRSPKEPSDPEI